MGKKKKKKVIGETYSKNALKVRTTFFRSKDIVISVSDRCIINYMDYLSEKALSVFSQSVEEIKCKDSFELKEFLDLYEFLLFMNENEASRSSVDFGLKFIKVLSVTINKSSSDVMAPISLKESVRIAGEVFDRFSRYIVTTSFDLLEVLLKQFFIDNVDKLFALIYNNIDKVIFKVPSDKVYGLSYHELLHQFLSHFDECTSDILRDKLKELDDVVEEEELFLENKVSYNYISSYKELNSLATSNGYIYDRSNGDHGIFKNGYGNVVVIPQGRSIGKGLSIVIQKGIKGGDRDV